MLVDLWLSNIVSQAALKCHYDAFNPEIRPSDAQFGDFQANGVLQYAKKNNQNPRKIAESIVDCLKNDEKISNNLEISLAGPGFINFKFKNEFLCNWLNFHDSIESFKPSIENLFNKTIVVDYSSPNTAKQMHIGHLRSMNIGESICRLLKFCEANIIKDNHIGDWGTQFGIILMAIKKEQVDLEKLPKESALSEIENLYKLGNALVKEDNTYLNIAHRELVKLQNGDKENFAIWKKINELSYKSFEEIYENFGIKFDYVLGESFYQDKVNSICDSLFQIGLAKEDAGALVVFFEDDLKFQNQPFIIRKSDGASNYATTDLATVKYRIEKFCADEIIYVTDGRQQDHFQQLFLTVKKWFAATNTALPIMRHVWFGTILGEDGRAIKTRDGSPIYLQNVTNEAKKRAYQLVKEKNPTLSEEEKMHIANVVGVSAIKYFDLAQNRTNDYMFSWENMLSFDGNTAVYMLYAVARLNSILGKADLVSRKIDSIDTEEERSLIRKLIYFQIVLKKSVVDLRPHYLCTYLYELAGEYSSFYNTNRILVEDEKIQNRRLVLCQRTLLVLRLGLHLLGIETLNKM